MVAGLIERRSDLFPQIENFRFQLTFDNFESGFRRLSLGLFIKFVLADNISPYIKIYQVENPWLV